MFEWGDLRHFLAVARTGSTSAAASELGVNQTTVARRIATLEEALGDRLFDRTTGGYKLTELGASMVEHAERVEIDVAHFHRQVTQRSRRLGGIIRVTTNDVLANVLLTPWLSDFATLYPDIQVETLIADRFFDLERGEADIAIRAGAIGVDSDKLVMRKLSNEAWAAYCGESYAEKHGVPTSYEEMKGHSIVGIARPETSYERAAPTFWRVSQEHGAIVRTASSSLTNLAVAVRNGMGVAPLPCIIGNIEPGFVRCFALPDVSAGITMITRAELRDLPHIRIFTDFIVARIAPMRALIEGREERRKQQDGIP